MSATNRDQKRSAAIVKDEKQPSEEFKSVLDTSKCVTKDMWVITQIAAGHSTESSDGWCHFPKWFDAGHCSLVIETRHQNMKIIYKFDYRNKPPNEIKEIEEIEEVEEIKEIRESEEFGNAEEAKESENSGQAWLYKNVFKDPDADNNFKRHDSYINHYRNLPESRKHSWECKNTIAVVKLVTSLEDELKRQNTSDNLSKNFSILWENCFFLMTEKLSQHPELGINVRDPEYMKKFHLGGWKYSILFGMPTSILFASTLSSLYSIFEMLALNRAVTVAFMDSRHHVASTMSFTTDKGVLEQSSFLHEGYLILPAALIYGSSNLTMFLAIYFDLRSNNSSVKIRNATVIHGLLTSFALSAASLTLESYLSPIENWKEVNLLLWILKELAIPLVGLVAFIASHFGLPYLLRYRDILQEEQSAQITALMQMRRNERIDLINKHISASLIPVFGMLSKAIWRTPMNVYVDANVSRKTLSPLFFITYPMGCLAGTLISSYIQPKKTATLLYLFIRSNLIYLGVCIPPFILVLNKINRIQNNSFEILLYRHPELNLSMITSMDTLCDHLITHGKSWQEMCDFMLSYFTTRELIQLTGFSAVGYLIAYAAYSLLRCFSKTAPTFYAGEVSSLIGYEKQIHSEADTERTPLTEQRGSRAPMNYQSVSISNSARALNSSNSPAMYGATAASRSRPPKPQNDDIVIKRKSFCPSLCNIL